MSRSFLFFFQYGHVEDVSLVLNLETGEHRGFAFVVFQQHEVCDQVFNTAKLLSVNGHLVKIQKSKPSKAVAELAKQAGLYDSEGNVTPLLEQLLQAGKQVIMLVTLMMHIAHIHSYLTQDD